MAFTVSRSDTLLVRGDLDVVSGTLLLRDGQISRAALVQENLVEFGISLQQLLVWDDIRSHLPATPAADDLGLDAGSFGSAGPIAKTSDSKAATTIQYGRFFFPVPENWTPNQSLQLALAAGMDTTVSDGTATLDVECHINNVDGDVTPDLCLTGAQSINSLTKTTKTFALDTPGILIGDVLDFRLTVSITDAATATAVIGEISKIALLADIRG